MDGLPTPLLEEKWRQWFRFFDVTNDGFLDATDFVTLAENISSITGASKEEADQTREEWCKWFDLLSASRMDMETCVAGHATIYRDKAHHVELTRTTGSIMFDAIDLDKSGLISRDELAIFYRAAGRVNDKLVDEVFKYLDKDGDGSVDREEFVDEWIRYFTDEHSENNLFKMAS